MLKVHVAVGIFRGMFVTEEDVQFVANELCLCGKLTFNSRVPSGTWKPGKPRDLNYICPGPEIDWIRIVLPKVRKPGQN